MKSIDGRDMRCNQMNVLDGLLRISECWKLSTGEKFNVNGLVSINVDTFGTIHFEMRDGNLYRIRSKHVFAEKYHGWEGWKRI